MREHTQDQRTRHVRARQRTPRHVIARHGSTRHICAPAGAAAADAAADADADAQPMPRMFIVPASGRLNSPLRSAQYAVTEWYTREQVKE